jgi:hypothetical protein
VNTCVMRRGVAPCRGTNSALLPALPSYDKRRSRLITPSPPSASVRRACALRSRRPSTSRRTRIFRRRRLPSPRHRGALEKHCLETDAGASRDSSHTVEHLRSKGLWSARRVRGRREALLERASSPQVHARVHPPPEVRDMDPRARDRERERERAHLVHRLAAVVAHILPCVLQRVGDFGEEGGHDAQHPPVRHQVQRQHTYHYGYVVDDHQRVALEDGHVHRVRQAVAHQHGQHPVVRGVRRLASTPPPLPQSARHRPSFGLFGGVVRTLGGATVHLGEDAPCCTCPVPITCPCAAGMPTSYERCCAV